MASGVSDEVIQRVALVIRNCTSATDAAHALADLDLIDPVGMDRQRWEAENRLRAALRVLEAAWTDPGPRPDYHEQVKNYLWATWPWLVGSVDEVVQALQQERHEHR